MTSENSAKTFIFIKMLIADDAEVAGFRCTGGQRWSDASDPIRTCHDLELLASGRWTPESADTLVAGCRCPDKMYLDRTGRCIVARECSCYDEESDTVVPHGRTLRRECSIWYASHIYFSISLNSTINIITKERKELVHSSMLECMHLTDYFIY